MSATYESGVVDGLQIALDEVDLSIRTFDDDPPDSKQQTGFLEGLRSVRHDIAKTLEDTRTTSASTGGTNA